MKVKKLQPVSNLYFVLLLIALLCLIFYILDICIGKIQNNLEGKGNEHFNNLTPSLSPPELTPSLSNDKLLKTLTVVHLEYPLLMPYLILLGQYFF